MSPKVLIVSNTALSTSNSNGRTLGMLLSGISKENLMQFCIKEEVISGDLIENSYCISDAMILKSMPKKKIFARKLLSANAEKSSASVSSGKKTAWKFLVREYAWSIKSKATDFMERAKAFGPDIVLYQMGPSGFLADLACDLSEECNAALIVFTTEDYYFKQWNFIEPNRNTFTFAQYMKRYRKATERLLKTAQRCIANTPLLAEKYAEKFGVQTDVIMAAASETIASHFNKQENTIVYAGNLTLNRHKSIMDVAHVANRIDPHMVISVFGQTTPEIEAEFASCPNIVVKGFVSYEALLPQLANAKLLLHCESFDEFYVKDLQSAFSTKIADSLASGVPLLLFAPESFAETEYLVKEECAFVCTSNSQLYACMESALTGTDARTAVVEKAKSVADRNHSAKKNQEKMYAILASACNH